MSEAKTTRKRRAKKKTTDYKWHLSCFLAENFLLSSFFPPAGAERERERIGEERVRFSQSGDLCALLKVQISVKFSFPLATEVKYLHTKMKLKRNIYCFFLPTPPPAFAGYYKTN